MPKNTNFHFANQKVMTAKLFLLNQTKLAQLLQMVVSDTWAAETERALDLSNTLWTSTLEKMPINLPGLAS